MDSLLRFIIFLFEYTPLCILDNSTKYKSKLEIRNFSCILDFVNTERLPMRKLLLQPVNYLKFTLWSNFFSYILRALNSNNFSGEIPPSLGNLRELIWLDLADNQLSGPLPISAKNGSGLDQLLKTKHLSVLLMFIHFIILINFNQTFGRMLNLSE
jgi:hypothetical protein